MQWLQCEAESSCDILNSLEIVYINLDRSVDRRVALRKQHSKAIESFTEKIENDFRFRFYTIYYKKVMEYIKKSYTWSDHV